MLGVMAWNNLYHSAFLDKHHLRFVEGFLHEDVLWSFQIACLKPKISIVNKITYYYRKRTDSITALNYSIRASHCFKVYTEEINFVFTNNLTYNFHIFHCVNKYLNRVYLYTLWNGNSKLTEEFYLLVRNSQYWNFPKIWAYTHDWKYIFIHFHRYLPKHIGYKFAQIVYAKCFDKT